MTFKKKLKLAGVVALSLTGLVLLTSMLPRGGTAQSWVIFSMIGLLIGLSLLFYWWKFRQVGEGFARVWRWLTGGGEDS